MKRTGRFALLLSSCCFLSASLLFFAGTARSALSVCAKVKIEILQEMTFERQAFDAHMQINNGLATIPLHDVGVEVLFTDEAGDPVRASSDPNDPNALFFIRIDSMEGTEDVSGNGTVAPSTTADIHWLIIPAPASVADAPTGAVYYVGARLTYTLGGEEHITTVTPDYIRVRPLPLLTLDYFLPEEVYGDDPFTFDKEPSIPFSLGVRIANNGNGVAGDVKIDSAQPRIVENENDQVIDFLIESSEVDGKVTPDTLLIDFGDIEPVSATVGRWVMTCPLSGRFVSFEAEYSHSNDLGGELTSLIEAVNTHVLIRNVLVDVQGRDAVRDFLGRDDDFFRVYESDAGVTLVTDLSSSAVLTPEDVNEEEAVYELTVPPTAGFFYLRFDDPLGGEKLLSKVVRSDGKVIRPENGWLSKNRVDSNWFYYSNVFDFNSTGRYTLTFIDPANAPKPLEFGSLEDPVVKEGEELSFLIKVKDPYDENLGPLTLRTYLEGEIPDAPGEGSIRISVGRLPVGAEFIDYGNGTGLLRWTPEPGQAGNYPLVFTVTDGEFTTTSRYHLTITDMANTPTAQFSVDDAGGTAPHAVSFFDETLSVDGIVSWAWEFGDGGTSEEQHPLHVYEREGTYSVSLTVTEADGDRSALTRPDLIIVESDIVGDLPLMEFAHIDVDHTWQVVSLENSYTDPVVTATVVDPRDPDQAMVRIRNVGATEFEIRLEEGKYADGIHAMDRVSYIVMESGRHIREDGSAIVAGHTESTSGREFSTYEFTEPFALPPVVTASLAGDNDPTPATVVLRRIDTGKFQFRLQCEEAEKDPHGSDRVDFIAWEPSSGISGKTQFEVGTVEKVAHGWKEQLFLEPFASAPALVATRQTHNGGNLATVVCRKLNAFGFEVHLAEESSRDPETNHAKETVGFIALSTLSTGVDSDGDGLPDLDEESIYGTHPFLADSDEDGIPDGFEKDFWGADWDFDADGDGMVNLLDRDSDNDGYRDGLELLHGYDPADPDDLPAGPIMEFGNVAVRHEWRYVPLAGKFLDPVVVATIVETVDPAPAFIGIRNSYASGFEVRLTRGLFAEWDHGPCIVSFIVMERGLYTLPDGALVAAGHAESTGNSRFAKVEFARAFSVKPVVTASMAGDSDPPPAVVSLRSIKVRGFELRLRPEEASSVAPGVEQVDYIAWEPSSGVFDETLFEVAYFKQADDEWREYPFGESFHETPSLVAAGQNDSGDPYTLLCRELTLFDVQLRIVEDTSADPETNHGRETIGFIAVGRL